MMDAEVAKADKAVLAEVVRFTQKMGWKGNKGGWKEFLACHDKRFGAGSSDPWRRPIDVLVDFLQTFTDGNDCQRLKNMIRSRSNQAAIEKFVKRFPDKETPQQRLVRMTIEHPQYARRYTFPSYEEGWVVLPVGYKLNKAMKSKILISVDCEMVLCEDGTDALIRVCAVDQNFKVKLDELVKPNKAIADYRTSITGVSAKDLNGITCSLEDVQKSLVKMLSHGTILVGHGLHNDLEALKIVHPRVIDTPYIFKYKDLNPSFTPSLNNLCKAVLGREVRKEGEPHDCVNDAKAAMELVLAKIEKGFCDPIRIEGKQMAESDLAKLFLHKIPVEVPCQELGNIFPIECTIETQSDKRGRGPFYSTFAVFKDESEAGAVFNEIDGNQTEDSFGRTQKQVSLKLGKGKTVDLYVRKMRSGNEMVSPKRTYTQEGGIQNKRQKTSNILSDSVDVANGAILL